MNHSDIHTGRRWRWRCRRRDGGDDRRHDRGDHRGYDSDIDSDIDIVSESALI